MKQQRFAITVCGIVQGVGFRPHIYRLATELGLSGWVLNFTGGVDIEIEGEAAVCAAFLAALRQDAPPASRVDSIQITEQPPCWETGFRILASREGNSRSLISPDLAICPDCLAELLNPQDRRYGYPFINCTNCGPRFTIIEDLPYDRPFTTMKTFPMCIACREEYEDPLNRRFHAQPNACADCGPNVRFTDAAGQTLPGEPLTLAREALRNGGILAVKGLGGYHLACDATNEQAVRTLRSRKLRWHKPLALMLPDMERVRLYCHADAEEEKLLSGIQRPIVLLRRRLGAPFLATELAPGHNRLGVMLPYTPLHMLLLQGFDALVMTSANFSEEPIVYDDAAAINRLRGLADFFLTHNRLIFRRADDSVAIFAANLPRLLRRSRGYAPQPLDLAGCQHQLLAVGGQEKNTFCLTRAGEAFLSQHIGELDDAFTYREYQQEIEYFKRMFSIEPQAVACDLHPDYASTRYAVTSSLPCVKVQHHHAHLASVLAEYGIKKPLPGLIFDGTGYGTDGRLWGGELLYGDCAHFERLAHLVYLPLAGGQAAIREPWRQALAALYVSGGEKLAQNPCWQWPQGWQTVLHSVKQGVNAPLSCGMGRLFDAVAALCGLHPTVSYEGQAAIALEQIIDNSATGAYSFTFDQQDEHGCLLLDWRPLILELVADKRQGVAAGIMAARFHRAVARLCVELALWLKERYGADTLALSGGCWQNVWLLEQVSVLLEQAGFTALSNSAVPVNDGGLAFGQAAVAAARLERGGAAE